MSENQKKTLNLAIVSLVFGCLVIIPFLGILFGLVAIITGIIALVEISKNKDTLGGRGLAIAGIVLGGLELILTVIIGVFLVMSLPRFVALRSQARVAQCEASVAAIRAALASYEAWHSVNTPDYHGTFPASIYDLDDYFQDGEIPMAPWIEDEYDWDDFYDRQEGKIDTQEACAPGKL